MRRGRPLRRALALVVLAGLVFGGGAAGYLLVLYPRSAGPGEGRTVEVEIPWGGGASEVARLAAEAGAVQGSTRFALYLRLSGIASRLQAGRHRLRDDWSPAEVARALTRPGLGREVRVTLREGQSRLDYADELDRLGVVSRQAFLDATEDEALLERHEIEGESAEGYLFPETYLMRPGSKAAEVVDRLVGTFWERAGPVLAKRSKSIAKLESDLEALELSLAERRALRGSPPPPPRKLGGVHAAVILASIVEAETPHADERPLVAAVFLNRLRSPAFGFRRLQADPTVRYGCRAEADRAPSCRDASTKLTKAQLQDGRNRYNTYAHPGLPPGPIGNPSLPSLEAVLAPADSGALYFVVAGEGRHEFSDTLEEHNAAVERYRAGRGPGEGVAPSDRSD